MVVNYKHLGAILGSIGSFFEFMIGLTAISYGAFMHVYFSFYLLIINYVRGFIMVLISALGMYGSVLVFKNEARGYKYLLGAGAIGVIGTLIPIGIFVNPLFSPSHLGLATLHSYILLSKHILLCRLDSNGGGRSCWFCFNRKRR